MATMSKPTPEEGLSHDYKADARLLSGQLQRPVEREIGVGAFVSLKGRRDRHVYQRSEAYDTEGLISCKTGYARVSGSHPEGKSWMSLATAVIEDLNVLDVITADRVVAQACTEHLALDGHVPSVTFLGSRFENLRINGDRVEVKLELGICGDKPAGDGPYFDDSMFLDRIQRQNESVRNILGLPEKIRDEYDKELHHLGVVRKSAGAYGTGYKPTTLKCSIVQSIGESFMAKSFGNILQIPGFGVVTLGRLEVEQSWSKEGKVTTYFDLTMLDIKMGSIAEGTVQVANVGVNGNHVP